jgi:hypothetical protein
MIRVLWDLYKIPSKMTYWQKLRFVYMLALLLTPRSVPVVPRYIPYIEEDEAVLVEPEDYPVEPLAYTALRVADLVTGVKGLAA